MKKSGVFFLYAHNRKYVCCLAPGYQMSIKKLCGDLTNQGVKQVSISSGYPIMGSDSIVLITLLINY